MAGQGLGCGDLPIVSTVCRGGVNAVTDPAGTAKDVVTAPIGAATDKVSDWLVTGVTDAGTSLVEGLDHHLTTATSPDLGAGWFLGNYNTVLGVALVVTAITFIIQIVGSLIRREPGMLTRAVTGSAVAVVGGFAILAVCQLTVTATDELCSGLLQASGSGSLGSSLRSIWVEAITDLGPGAWLLAVFLGFLFIIGAVMLWVAMFLREISIYVLAVFAPIAFAGYGWDRTRGWLRRWGEIVAALIFSKFVIYVVFILGVAMMGQAANASGLAATITQLLGGMCLLLMGALAPWATHRFITFAGSAAGDVTSHASPRGAAGAGAMVGVTGAMAVGRTVAGGATSGPVGAAAGAGQGASQMSSAGSNASGSPGGSGSSSGSGGSSGAGAQPDRGSASSDPGRAQPVPVASGRGSSSSVGASRSSESGTSKGDDSGVPSASGGPEASGPPPSGGTGGSSGGGKSSSDGGGSAPAGGAAAAVV